MAQLSQKDLEEIQEATGVKVIKYDSANFTLELEDTESGNQFKIQLTASSNVDTVINEIFRQ